MVDGFVNDSSKSSGLARKKVVSSHVHKRTEKARTLMRTGLKKPAGKQNPRIDHFSGSFNPQREIRAKSTPKHHGVQRFGIPSAPSNTDRAKEPVSGEIVGRSRPNGHSRPAAAAPMPSMVASASHQRLERMLDQALTNADSHKQALRYQAARHFWQRRWLGGRLKWLAIVLIIMIAVAGLAISWQKVPQLSIRAAGMRAHITPAIPAYKPDGYKMDGPAQAVSGTVTIRYVSSNDSLHDYEIVQAQSNLTSQLVGQSVVPKGAPVQTSQVEGNTIYIYGGDNDAAWVNNGVLYTIKDHAKLSSDELIKIVQGLNP
jgi:hypothetical protein